MMYFVAKRFAGPRAALVTVLVAIVLPKPAEFGADALRDWPNLLFLLVGLLLLLAAAQRERWWLYGLAGLACGLGSLIRTETLQLAVCGLVWLGWKFVKARGWAVRRGLLASAAMLLLSVGAIQGTYLAVGGGKLPHNVHLLRPFHISRSSIYTSAGGSLGCVVLGAEDGTAAEFLLELARKIQRNLHEVFVPFWAVGMVCFLRKRGNVAGRALFNIFLLASLSLIVGRYYLVLGPAVHTRYVMPLVMTSLFFVPVGLRVAGLWVDRLFRRGTTCLRKMRRKLPARTAFLALGILICLPRLLEPVGADKRHYRDAARWLSANARPDDLIATMDKRICFYAGFRTRVYSNDFVLLQRYASRRRYRIRYIAAVFPENGPREIDKSWQPVFQAKSGRSSRATRVVVLEYRPAEQTGGKKAPQASPL